MVRLIAICEICEKAFQSSFEIMNSYEIHMKNNQETCPYCGGIAFIPDGIYNVKNEMVDVFSIDRGKELYKLEKILKSVNKKDSFKDLEDKIDSEIPQYHGIMDVIRNFCDKNKSVIAAAGVLSQILFSSYGIYADNQKENLHNEIHQKDEIIKHQHEIIKEQREIIKDKSE
jgi:hypothetical protein